MADKLDILYLTPNFSSFFAATYDGMIRSIEPYCDLTLYGPNYKIFDDFGHNRNILEIIARREGRKEPDVIIMWDIEGSGWAGDFTNMQYADSLKILWSVDIHNDAVPHRLQQMKDMGIDLILMTYDKHMVTHAAKEFEKIAPVEFYPFSVDPEMFKPMDVNYEWDVSLIGNMSSSYYPFRNKAHMILRNQLFTYHDPMMGIFTREDFARHINESKICVTGSSSYKYLVQKYYEVTACGTLLMADDCMDLEDQHFKDGENFIMVDESNLLDKVNYYLETPEELIRISDNGRDLIMKHHTHDIRARQLMKIIEKYLGDR